MGGGVRGIFCGLWDRVLIVGVGIGVEGFVCGGGRGMGLGYENIRYLEDIRSGGLYVCGVCSVVCGVGGVWGVVGVVLSMWNIRSMMSKMVKIRANFTILAKGIYSMRLG